MIAKPHTADLSEDNPYLQDISMVEQPGMFEGQVPSAANAAVALAQLHSWDSDYVSSYEGVTAQRSITYAQ